MASSKSLQALGAVLQQCLQTEYPLPRLGATDFCCEAQTVLALKQTCRRLNAYDSSGWEMGGASTPASWNIGMRTLASLQRSDS